MKFKNQLKVILFICSVSFTAFAQEKTTMYINGRDIFTTCGEKVVLRGVNEMMIWSKDQTGTSILPEIAKTGANAVRLAWTTAGSATALDQLITNCIKNNMIPIPELHDATGKFALLQQCLDYWKKPEVVAVIQKHKKWVLVNIANEVGSGSETDLQFENYYKDAISQLRTAGYDMPLIIDAGGWGNQERYVVNTGANLLKSDPLKKLIFSVHTYWGGSNQNARLDKLVSDMKTANLAFIIGEGPQKAATPQSCDALFPYIYLLDKFQTEGLGWLAWSWGAVDNNDCGAPQSVFDITTDGTFLGLTDFGKEISTTAKNSIKNTSVRPGSLVNGTCSITGKKDANFKKFDIKVFPNPNDGNFMIEGNLNGKWTLYNALGHYVVEGLTNSVDLKMMESGMYALEANGDIYKVIIN